MMYVVAVLPLICFLEDSHQWIQNWYADDSSCIGELYIICKAMVYRLLYIIKINIVICRLLQLNSQIGSSYQLEELHMQTKKLLRGYRIAGKFGGCKIWRINLF